MIITGWKVGVKTIDAVKAIRKHTGMSLKESKNLVDRSINGEMIRLPDDFVLREDLEDFGFKIK